MGLTKIAAQLTILVTEPELKSHQSSPIQNPKTLTMKKLHFSNSARPSVVIARLPADSNIQANDSSPTDNLKVRAHLIYFFHQQL